MKPTGNEAPPGPTMRSLRGIDVAALRARVKASGQRLVEIDLGACRDLPGAIAAIGRSLALPSWFGANLDALYDALTDLGEGGDAVDTGTVILLDPLPPASPGFGATERRRLLAVFRDAVRQQKLERTPLSVYYR